MSEWARFWVPILAQVLTTAALVGTLSLSRCQYSEAQRQFEKTDRRSIDTAEDASWRDALGHASKESGSESVYGVYALVSFLKIEKYQRQSRNALVTSLGHLIDPDVQRNVLQEFDYTADELGAISWNLYLSWRIIGTDYSRKDRDYRERVQLKAQQDQRRAADRTLPKGEREIVAVEPDPTQFDAVEDSWAIVSGRLEAMMSSGIEVHREHIALVRCDLSKLALGNIKFHRGAIVNCAALGAHLKGFRAIETDWTGTAWWQAADIDRELLEELEQRFSFQPDAFYSRTDKLQTMEDYTKAVERLRRSL